MPVEKTIKILVGLLPSNKVLMQISEDDKALAYVELDRAGAMQVSNQLAEMARKLDGVQ